MVYRNQEGTHWMLRLWPRTWLILTRLHRG
jgi:hypothetical protein